MEPFRRAFMTPQKAARRALHYFVVNRQSVAACLLGASALLGFARSARAEQFVLLDATFDYTWEDAMNAKPSLSHFYVNEKNFLNTQRPKNWLSPVGYRNGTLHVRTEVFKKPPGDQQVGWTLCYIANQGEYGCADTNYYKAVGVYDREVKMTDWWQNDKIQWNAGIKQVDLIYAINDSGSGHITNYPALKDHTTPTRVRITMVQVSAGSTYDASIITTGNTGGAGGGGAGGSAGGSGSAGGLGLGGIGSAAGGGYGGLLGMAGSDANSDSPTVGTTTVGGLSSATAGSGGAASTPVAPSAGSAPGSAANTAPETDAGCNFANAPNAASSLGGILAALSGLALLRRTQRLLRR